MKASGAKMAKEEVLQRARGEMHFDQEVFSFFTGEIKGHPPRYFSRSRLLCMTVSIYAV